jgi:hypothetical protein
VAPPEIGEAADTWPRRGVRVRHRVLLDLHKLGISGIALGWVDYVDGFAEFNERVIPLMIEAGLRQDLQSSWFESVFG